MGWRPRIASVSLFRPSLPHEFFFAKIQKASAKPFFNRGQLLGTSSGHQSALHENHCHLFASAKKYVSSGFCASMSLPPLSRIGPTMGNTFVRFGSCEGAGGLGMTYGACACLCIPPVNLHPGLCFLSHCRCTKCSGLRRNAQRCTVHLQAAHTGPNQSESDIRPHRRYICDASRVRPRCSPTSFGEAACRVAHR